jgi:hypothetical protein
MPTLHPGFCTFVQLEDPVTGTVRSCWVDAQLRIGQWINLVDSDEPDRVWTVAWVSTQVRLPNEKYGPEGWKVRKL